jgi:hypothetical protein
VVDKKTHIAEKDKMKNKEIGVQTKDKDREKSKDKKLHISEKEIESKHRNFSEMTDNKGQINVHDKTLVGEAKNSNKDNKSQRRKRQSTSVQACKIILWT